MCVRPATSRRQFSGNGRTQGDASTRFTRKERDPLFLQLWFIFFSHLLNHSRNGKTPIQLPYFTIPFFAREPLIKPEQETEYTHQWAASLTRKCRHAAVRVATLEMGMYLIRCTYNFCIPHQELSKKRILDGQRLQQWLQL